MAYQAKSRQLAVLGLLSVRHKAFLMLDVLGSLAICSIVILITARLSAAISHCYIQTYLQAQALEQAQMAIKYYEAAIPDAPVISHAENIRVSIKQLAQIAPDQGATALDIFLAQDQPTKKPESLFLEAAEVEVTWQMPEGSMHKKLFLASRLRSRTA